jgi:hypothetical protein
MMGRWGHRVFEGDQDLDIACQLDEFSGVKLCGLVNQSDMLAPAECREWYKSEEFRSTRLPTLIMEARQALDSGVGFAKFEELIQKAPGPSKSSWDEGNYKLLLFGALMMRAGAQLADKHRQIMFQVLLSIPAHDSHQRPTSDHGFRLPGMLQFKAALANYNDGIARSFEEPR